MDTDEKETSFVDYIFVPLSSPRISKAPHFFVNITLDCIPMFDGRLIVDFLEYFMNYIDNDKFVFEDDLMMAFA